MSVKRIKVRVNDFWWEGEIKPHKTLLKFLREDLGLTGTKCGCDNGECGACTVLINGKAIQSCLVLTPEVDGQHIETVEGLGSPGGLHPLQEAFLDLFAVQCGFCTPGMLMAAKALLDENSNPTETDILNALRGHLCRCTGYEAIIKAVQEAAGRMSVG